MIGLKPMVLSIASKLLGNCQNKVICVSRTDTNCIFPFTISSEATSCRNCQPSSSVEVSLYLQYCITVGLIELKLKVAYQA